MAKGPMRLDEEKATDVTGWVYFVGAYEGADLKFIKIGYTSRRNPNVRREEIGDGVPHETKLLVATPGCITLERQYHQEFSKWRARGEWFRPSGEIQCRVDTLLAMPGSWKPGFAQASRKPSRRRRKVRQEREMTPDEQEERFLEVIGARKVIEMRKAQR